MEIVFDVPGEPRGKGRPRFSKTGHTYTDEKTRAYECEIIACYKKRFGGYRLPDTAVISIGITAHYSIPKSASKAARDAMRYGSIKPTKKPDLDNVIKAVLDALNGVAYKDDSHVTRIEAEKVYSDSPKIEIKLNGDD